MKLYPFSATIKKSNLPHPETLPTTEKKQAIKKDHNQAKNVAQVQRSMDIANSRHITTSEIFQYDLLDSSPLFDGDFLVKLPKKLLVNELESMIPENEMIFSKTSVGNTVLFVYFMSIIRRLSLNQIKTSMTSSSGHWEL